uniref:Uncharacterized protein n=1 Tax=Ciona savignyi TaxID=51511 RepID=H2Y6N1_CIOSA
MIVSVMSNIIRGLLDDPTFQEAAKEAGSESIPYFPQLAREEEDLGLDVVPPQTGGEFPHTEVVLPQTQGQTQGETPQTEGAHHVDLDESEDRTSPKQLMDEILKQGEGSRPQSSDSTVKSPRVSEGICSSLPVSTTLKRMQEQEIRRSPMFGGILEELLSSTLSNIMEEALSGEVILTARPRVVALPPSRVQSATNRPPSLTPSRKSDSATSRRQRSRGGSSNGKSRNSAKQKK